MKILVADDHALFREGLVHVLASMADDVTVIQASDFAEALRLAAEEEGFDLALIDLSMPGMEPYEGLRALRQQAPDLPIVVVSALDDRHHILKSIDSGARGFIPKSLGSRVLVGALGLVLAGGVYLPPAVIGRDGLDDADSPAASLSPSRADIRLTPRQRDVLVLLTKGLSNKEIARRLHLAEGTVKLHLAAILKTLDVTNRVQAAVKAAALGLVPPHVRDD
jgi:DNA-binding NarL/FixJ family response regulator